MEEACGRGGGCGRTERIRRGNIGGILTSRMYRKHKTLTGEVTHTNAHTSVRVPSHGIVDAAARTAAILGDTLSVEAADETVIHHLVFMIATIQVDTLRTNDHKAKYKYKNFEGMLAPVCYIAIE